MELSDLALERSIVQLNTVAGYTYLDQAGKVMNWLDKRLESIGGIKNHYRVATDGLSVGFQGVDKIVEFNAQVDRTWLSFECPDCLEDVKNRSESILGEACRLMSISRYSRIGWRCWFTRSFDSLEALRSTLLATETLGFLSVSDQFKAGLSDARFHLHTQVGAIHMNLRGTTGKKTKAEEKEGQLIFLFDGDFFKDLGKGSRDIRDMSDDMAELLGFIKKDFASFVAILTRDWK